jgi:hypothetical protein
MVTKSKSTELPQTLNEYTEEYAEIVSKRNRDLGRKPYVVCTDKRGVMFGYADPVFSEPLMLYDMRNCILWAAQVSGVFGLSDVGPIGWTDDSSRIGARTQEALLTGITARCLCSDRAELCWNLASPKSRTK